jgi:hypothetical protein
VKKLLLKIFILIFSSQLCAQPTWEHVSNIVMATLPGAVVAHDGGFIELGYTIDTVGSVNLKVYLRDWTNEGELLDTRIYYDSNLVYFLVARSMTAIGERNNVFLNRSEPINGNSGILFYHFNGLDTLSSYVEDSVSVGLNEIPRNMVVRRLLSDKLGNYYAMVDFSRPGEGIDFFVMKYTAEHERLWTYNDPQSFSLENSFSACFSSDGKIYIPYYRPNTSGYTRLLCLDAVGNELSDEQVESSGIWQDCIYTPNDKIILVGRNVNTAQNFGASISCIDLEGNTQWSYIQDGGNESQYNQAGFKRVFQTEDGNYAVGGVLYERTDTPDPDDDPYNYVICFRKLTESGEMLWERRYQKVISFQDRHDLADMTITSDGGIVGVMVALDNTEEVPEVGHPQRAWILKLDECGCLVPGCDSSCPEVEESGSGSPYYFGPNPASNLFSVGSATMDKYSFSIYDDMGRLILEKENAQKDMGYLVDVENWSSGMYFLHIQDQEGKGYVEKVVVE